MYTSTPDRAARRLVAALAGELAVKTIQARALDFEVAITEFATEVFGRNRTSGWFAQQLRTLIRTSAEPAYTEEGPQPDDFDESDRQIIDGWIDDQLDFVGEFAEAVRDAIGDTEAQAQIFRRAETWGQSLLALGQKGIMSLQGNAPGTWELGDTEKHCPTCARLNGQRHRLKWYLEKGFIPQEPGSDTLDCGGWNCDCRIVDDGGKVLLP